MVPQKPLNCRSNRVSVRYSYIYTGEGQYHCAGKRGWQTTKNARGASVASAASEASKKNQKKISACHVVIQDLHEYSKIAILRSLKRDLIVAVHRPKLPDTELTHIV